MQHRSVNRCTYNERTEDWANIVATWGGEEGPNTHLGHTEIANFDEVSTCTEKDVLGFEVTMQQLAIMNVLHCQAQLYEECHHTVLGNEVAMLALHKGVEITARAVIHHDAQLAALNE